MTPPLNLVDIAVLLAGVVSLVAYLCRLDAMQWSRHKPLVIVMHIAWCVASAAAVSHAWAGQAGLIDVASVVGALAWIWLSWWNWRDNVPPHYARAGKPLDGDVLRQVAGGCCRRDR